MQHEIAVIGGGPSGSTAAIYLAEFGFDVCLIEKKIFPREILCGEFLSREVVNNLKELNLFSSFLNLKPNPISSFAMFYDKKEISTQLDFQAYGLKRSGFDNLLLMNAKAKGVKVYQPYEVSEIIKKMLVSTVENAEAKWDRPKGYKIGGKTGTAQIPIAGIYDPSKTIASFIGFAPALRPKFLTLVILKEPGTSPWGSETAAPLFFEIAKELFSYYGISPKD